MRTMVMLYLIFWLAPFAVAVGPIEGCGSIYTCFVPDVCTTDNADIAKSKVVEFTGSIASLKDNCPALIAIHEYRTNWAQISIESFSPDVSSIVFSQKDVNDDPKTQISCAINGEKVEGKFDKSMKSLKDNSQGAKLKCTFDARRDKMTQKVIDQSTSHNYKFTIVSKAVTMESQSTNKIMFEKFGCDPSKLVFHDEKHKEKVYTEIHSAPGKFECKDPTVFKKEFRGDGKSYRKVDKVECDVKFYIDSDPIHTSKSIDIRCVAEARYFCRYEVLGNGRDEKPQLVASDWTVVGPDGMPEPSKLFCPPEKRHLVVNKKIILDVNSKIKCVNYGNSKFWTVVQSADESHVLTENGPEVYCTAKVECDRMYKIPESSIPNGRLGSDRLPECFFSGTLHFGDKKVVRKWCDDKTGEFKFNAGGEDKVIKKDMIFKCVYPKNTEKADRKNAEHRAQIKIGGFIGAGICLILIAVAVTVAVVCVRWGVARAKKKTAARNAALFKTYGMTDNDKKAYRKEHNIPSEEPSEDKKIEEKWNWNDQLMHYKYVSMGHGTTDGQEFPCRSDNMSSIVAAGEDPTKSKLIIKEDGCPILEEENEQKDYLKDKKKGDIGRIKEDIDKEKKKKKEAEDAMEKKNQ